MATILIVDDRPTNREVLASLLGYQKHRILEAEDGRQALGVARAERPDLVISDVLMPTMDGYELVREMRADPALSGVPVIFSTAHYNEREAKELAQACGVRQILPKPCDPELVLRAVAEALRGAVSTAATIDESQFGREHFRLLTNKLGQKVDELRALNERLHALIGFSQELRAARDHIQLFNDFCYAARQIVAAKHAVVAILDDAGTRFRHFATSGMALDTSIRLRPSTPRDGQLGALLDRAEPLLRGNLTGDPVALGLPAEHPQVFSVLAVPVASPLRVYGWLCLSNKLGLEAFSDEERDLAAGLAAIVARIHENDLLYEELERRNLRLADEVAERRAAERALRASEERFRDVADAASDWIWEMDDELRFTYVSDRVREVGLDPGQAIGTSRFERRSGDDDGIWQGHLDRLKARAPFRDLLCEMGLVDGRRRVVKLTGKPVFDGAGKFQGYRGTGTDVTALHDSEQKLHQALKMEAVGQLTSGIAHDFNNLLSVVRSSGEFLAEELGPGELAGVVSDILQASERGAQLTHRLLAFSRRQPLEAVDVDVRARVGGMKDLLQRSLGAHIEIGIECADGLWHALVDPSQLENALLNLAVNARDAMPGGGRLTIAAANVELDAAAAAAIPDAKPGGYVAVTVRDTGSGIPPELIDKVFEPFFTTKEVGQGSGLGLSMIYGFIKQSGGTLKIDSTVGQGTAVTLYLPRPPSLGVAAAVAVERRHPNSTAGETIMVVEDEPLVRKSLVRQLERLGYKIVQAENGADALTKLAEHSIDLLFTDMVMPGGMSGLDLAEQARRIHPRLRVLFTSGYPDQGTGGPGWPGTGIQLLPKPYSRENLVLRLRDVLKT